MTKVQNIPEWLPDWCKPEQYPDPINTGKREWAWQFLRRNEDYQTAFLKISNHALVREWAIHCGIEDQVVSKLSPNDPSVIDNAIDFSEIETLYDEIRLKYQTGRTIPNPAYDHASLESSVMQRIFSVNRGEEKITKTVVTHTSRQVPVLIDLSIPIEPQLETVKIRLKDSAEISFGKPYRAAPQVDKFTNYLRILDARAYGVPYSKIGAVLYPFIENIYPDYYRNKKVQLEGKTAENYRDEKYKTLLLNAESSM